MPPAQPPQDFDHIAAAAMSVEQPPGPAANDTPPPVEEPAANEEQGLADMAHRLETALRRPAPAPQAAPAPHVVAPSYENLQREMANLLGRQSGSS